MNAKELNDRKEELNLTFDEIAKLSNIPKTTITNIFTGITKNPRYDTLSAICKVLNLPIDLITEEEHNAGALNTTTQQLNADQFAWLEIYDGLVEKYGQDFAKNMINLVDNFLNK